MNLCMILAFFASEVGGSNGVINEKFGIWYLVISLIYLEAGFCCNRKDLLLVLRDGHLILFLFLFIYIIIPALTKIGTYLLNNTGINIRLVKGMEVLHCLPPPFATSLALSRIARADISTSIVTTLMSRFMGLILSPVLLYIMLDAKVPPLTEINLREITCSTLIPMAIGIFLKSIYFKDQSVKVENRNSWISQLLLLLIAYNIFCDAFTVDVATLYAIDILVCVVIVCLSQIIITCMCWIFCSTWLGKNVFLASVFTCTFKSINFGEWLVKTTFHNTADTTMMNLPLRIFMVAQLLLGSLLASWLTP